MRLKSLLLSLAALGVASANATEFYVSPSGQATGSGSISSPWDLQTALNQPSSVKPGDTIWLRGGTHRLFNRVTKFTSRLTGASGQPITVRQYPGERAIIDGNIQQITGGWVNYWGFEIFNSNNNRLTSESGPFPQAWWVKYDGKDVDLCVSGFDLQAPNVKLINLVVHDSIGGGFGVNKASQNAEIYGCLSYYNGWQGADRAHGHGFYGQNAAPYVKNVKDNMFFENLAIGFQATGNGPEPVADNFTLEGNAFFQNGILARQHQANVLIGPFQGRAQNPKLIKNMVYDTMGSGSDSNIGYDGGSDNAVVQDNFFHTSVQFSPYNVNMTMTGNTFAGGTILLPSGYPNNTYLSSKPTANVVSVRPNQYESGRANIVIYNYEKLNSVNVNVSGIGLNAGDQYELHNVQDYFNDVVTGTYNGGTISVPMTGHSVAKAQGENFSLPPSTFPNFGAFVIMKKGGSTTPPSNTPPTVSNIPDQSTKQNTATAPISFTIGDTETSAANLTLTGTSSNTGLVPNANIVFGGSGANRTVTVTPASNQSGSSTITVKVSDGTSATSESFVVTVLANTAPTVSSISAQTTSENTATAAIPFTIGDQETAAANLVVTASSSNQSLIPNSNIVLGGSGSSRTVKVTPAANQSGSATITLSVSDGAATTTTSFTVTVTAVNHVPTISSIGAQTTEQDKAVGPINFIVGDAETAAGNLTVAAASSNTTLVPNGNIAIGGSGANRSLTITPASGKSGTSTVRVSVNDGSASSSTSFTLTVTATTNQPPDSGSTNKIYLGFEAEKLSNVAPMVVVTNAQLPAQRYVWSTVANQGTTTFTVDVPQADTYYMWCKILASTYASDSFFVSVDGKEDVFDAAEGKQSSNWQWSQVNGRNGTGTPLVLNPRPFSLTQGKHTVVIRGREAKAGLDRILITNDRGYVPKDIVAKPDSVTVYSATSTQIPFGDLVDNDGNLFEADLTVTALGKAQNGEVELVKDSVVYTPKADFTGTDTFTYTASDGQGNTSTATVTVTVQAADKVYLGLEAESGTIVSPMAVSTDTKAATLRYVASPLANQGTVSYTVDIPKTDSYVLWAKVLCPTYASDSFFVTVDGKEDVFDAAEGKQSSNWQWSQVNGRNGGGSPLALNPRVFSLSQGKHTIVIRGREPKAAIDRLVISNDRNYIPKDVLAVTDTVTANVGSVATISVSTLLSNDVDLFGDKLTITSVGTAQNGTVTLNGTTVTYTPKAGFLGTDSFTYTVSDGQGGTSTTTVTVKVQSSTVFSG